MLTQATEEVFKSNAERTGCKEYCVSMYNSDSMEFEEREEEKLHELGGVDDLIKELCYHSHRYNLDPKKRPRSDQEAPKKHYRYYRFGSLVVTLHLEDF